MSTIQEVTSEIILKQGREAGPSVAIFAGVHGNERVGVLALQELIPQLNPTRGTIYFAFANIPAIEQGVRMVNKNLNRCFLPGNNGDTYEDNRARELMAVMDKCDAVLDLHAFNETTGEPFIICEDNSLDIALKLEPTIISTNWAKAEPGGTDGYMYEKGKPGIGMECGPLSRPEEFKPVAVKAVHQFLKHFGMLDTDVRFSNSPKRVIVAQGAVHRTSEDFYLDPSLRSFQKLTAGQVIGSQDGKDFVASEGDYIIFPRPLAPIGSEAYIIGRAKA
jgi:predicted deacylase